MPIIFLPLYEAAKTHWNSTIVMLVCNVLKTLMEINQETALLYYPTQINLISWFYNFHIWKLPNLEITFLETFQFNECQKGLSHWIGIVRRVECTINGRGYKWTNRCSRNNYKCNDKSRINDCSCFLLADICTVQPTVNILISILSRVFIMSHTVRRCITWQMKALCWVEII